MDGEAQFGSEHAQAGVGGCLVWTGADGSAATLNLEDQDRNLAGEQGNPRPGALRAGVCY